MVFFCGFAGRSGFGLAVVVLVVLVVAGRGALRAGNGEALQSF